MNKANCTTAPQQVKDDEQLRKLRRVINSIDCMCQTQLGQISSLVSIILRAMESPDYWKHPGTIADTLGLLQYTAEDCASYVNGMAEEAGSNYVDEIGSSQTRRIWDAFRAAERAEACHE